MVDVSVGRDLTVLSVCLKEQVRDENLALGTSDTRHSCVVESGLKRDQAEFLLFSAVLKRARDILHTIFP